MMMKLILINLLAVTLVACGGGSSSQPTAPPVPVAGTLLSSECDEYTLVERFADGQGGSTETVTTRSTACGWDPAPYGELSETLCEDPYTLVSVYHDGAYGFYEEREADVEECGYIPPSLEVTIDNTYGDRFRPVIVTVNYTVQGEPAEWTYEVEVGRAVKVDDNTLHIYGDGSGDSVDFNLQINDESYLYQLKREPRCAVERNERGIPYDCLGYLQRGDWDLVYYGEGDQQVVQVELVVTLYDAWNNAPVGTEVFSGSKYEETVRRVAKYNKRMALDGIYIEFVLKHVVASSNTSLRQGEDLTAHWGGDIGLGRGYTYTDTCGVAMVNTRFSDAGFGFSACGYFTDLHELGHAVGIAHGPNNSAYAATGYIFPEFGHGDYGQCGSRSDDIMSYGSFDNHFYNSELKCCDVHPNDNFSCGASAGDRNRADSAYHWNRIRYDLALINDEHAKKDPAGARSRRSYLDDDRPLIID
jgi:hypothetical protein